MTTQTDSLGSDSSHTSDPSPDQFSLSEVDTSLRVPSKVDNEEQPHSTTEEVVADTDSEIICNFICSVHLIKLLLG